MDLANMIINPVKGQWIFAISFSPKDEYKHEKHFHNYSSQRCYDYLSPVVKCEETKVEHAVFWKWHKMKPNCVYDHMLGRGGV